MEFRRFCNFHWSSHFLLINMEVINRWSRSSEPLQRPDVIGIALLYSARLVIFDTLRTNNKVNSLVDVGS